MRPPSLQATSARSHALRMMQARSKFIAHAESPTHLNNSWYMVTVVSGAVGGGRFSRGQGCCTRDPPGVASRVPRTCAYAALETLLFGYMRRVECRVSRRSHTRRLDTQLFDRHSASSVECRVAQCRR